MNDVTIDKGKSEQPLSELGSLLKRHRVEYGLTIEHISEMCKINPKHLRAIEEGDWDSLPEPVYTRAFIRHFATLVGIEPDVAVSLYVSETGLDATSAVAAQTTDEPTPSRATTSSEPSRPAKRKRRRRKNKLILQWAILVIVFVVVGVTMIGIRALFTPRQKVETPEQSLTQPDLVTPRTLALLTPEEILEQRFDSGVGDEHIEPATVPSPPVQEDESVPAVQGDRLNSIVDDSLYGNEEEVYPALVLTAEVRDDCWFEVVADGERIFIGALTAGTVVNWEADETLTVTFGRPEGVYLTLNDDYLGVAGFGVITREFTRGD